MTRAEQVYVLLRSLLDYLPPPPTATSRIVAKSGSRGAAPDSWAQCKLCDGEGRRRVRGQEGPCGACGGAGRVKVDSYLGETVNTDSRDSYISDAERRDKRRRDAVRVDRILRLGEATGGEDELDVMERRRCAQRSTGSYRELERALRILRREDPLAYLRVTTWIVAGNEGEQAGPPWCRDTIVGPSLRDALDRAVWRLAELMPTPIRVPEWAEGERSSPGKGRWANGQAQERRNAEIRMLRQQGVAADVIARRYGLSVSSVCAITRQAA